MRVLVWETRPLLAVHSDFSGRGGDSGGGTKGRGGEQEHLGESRAFRAFQVVPRPLAAAQGLRRQGGGHSTRTGSLVQGKATRWVHGPLGEAAAAELLIWGKRSGSQREEEDGTPRAGAAPRAASAHTTASQALLPDHVLSLVEETRQTGHGTPRAGSAAVVSQGRGAVRTTGKAVQQAGREGQSAPGLCPSVRPCGASVSAIVSELLERVFWARVGSRPGGSLPRSSEQETQEAAAQGSDPGLR